jgi:Cu(I)/Ag(I) efflux system membrane fusion protein
MGRVTYDEGTLKTLSAYVDGRLDRLFADYTGVVVRQGDQLALLYSPNLYSAQVELLLARRARNEGGSATRQRLIQSRRDLYDSARQRLIELGMTEEQIEALEQSGQASSRLHLYAPISGTVIEKLAVEGQYVNEGQPIYRLADLSSVWLVLQLFPEEAAAVRYGQPVEAVVQSLPGRRFEGRVAFIEPQVDPRTRTIGVRVVVPNPDGAVKVGDYAKATINVPVTGFDDKSARIYDPELAGKWISPRHPHVIQASPGQCPICGVELVPATQFGFTDEPVGNRSVLVVPRNAVLMAGDHSVMYVETEPGRFEIRRVVTGPSDGESIAILAGVQEGERVATRGNFLIDSQMQLAGNPSLIDPTGIEPQPQAELPPEVEAALAELSSSDRLRAASQQTCPVSEMPLGSMGTPPLVNVAGRQVFICCEGCRAALLQAPDEYLGRVRAGARTDSQRPASQDSPAASSTGRLEPEDGGPAAGMPAAVKEPAAATDEAASDPDGQRTPAVPESVR